MKGVSGMAAERYYNVEFETQVDNVIRDYSIVLKAKNQKEAIGIARTMWALKYDGKKKTPHMFHCAAKRMEDVIIAVGIFTLTSSTYLMRNSRGQIIWNSRYGKRI